ncbi:MAG: helix-turn-helix domain-containing protein [Firmicutes bacterium]|nr:helix-turn-helix domain-containing protein [Bacillota bacterium]
MTKHQKTFAYNLKSLIQERGLKGISEFSKDIDIPRQTISDWIHKGRSPNLDALHQLTDFFDISLDELLGKTAI